MGRATSTFLKSLDDMNDDVLMIATTNLFDDLDKALIRRFDSIISFDRYSVNDKIDISDNLISRYQKNNGISKDKRLLSKIIKLTDNDSVVPGTLKNIIRTSIAFSSPDNDTDYLRRIFISLKKRDYSFEELKDNGFTVREIEILTGVSKSTVSRKIKE